MRDPDGTAYVLHVVGWLEGEGVEELLRVVDDARPGLVPPLIALMLDSGSE
jgi:hypothetical protein